MITIQDKKEMAAEKVTKVEELTVLDITSPKVLEIVIRADGKVIWVNINGICRLRVNDVSSLIFNDDSGRVKR